MKTIIVGLREVSDVETVREAVKLSGLEITELVSAASLGVRSAGERWANETGAPVRQFPVDRDDISHPDALIRIRDKVKQAPDAINRWLSMPTLSSLSGTDTILLQHRLASKKLLERVLFVTLPVPYPQALDYHWLRPARQYLPARSVARSQRGQVVS